LLSIAVEDGDVSLRGQVDTESEAELAALFVGRVPGVVSVHSELTWSDDGGKRH